MLESLLSFFQKGAFIYFDVKGGHAKFYDQKQGDFSSDKIVDIEIDPLLISEGNFGKMCEDFLSKITASGKKIPNGTAMTVILPDSAVTIDYVTMPTMKKKNISSALQTNIAKIYKNNSDLFISESIVSTNKKNTVLKCVMIQKAVTASLKASLAKHNLGLKCVTCEAFCLADAVLQLRPKYRKHDFIFLDARDGYTNIVICGKDKVYGFTSLPYGKEIIKSDEVISEYDVIDNDIAELAVLNAKENARAKKLTVSMELDQPDESVFKKEESNDDESEKKAEVEIEDVDDAAAPIESDHKLTKEEMVSLMRDMEEENKKDVKPATDSDEDDEEDEVEVQPVQEKIKVFIRKPKKYPKFMLRETPVDEDGFISENFRIFHKKILLYAQQCKFTEYLPKMEFAVVNVENVKDNVVKAAELEHEGSLSLKNLVTDDEKYTEQFSELVLFGATHLNAHSKNPKL